MVFHINNISVSHNSMWVVVKRLVDTLTGRDIPQFRVDHFGNRQDGIFIVLSEDGIDPGALKKVKTEVEDAVVSVKNEFRLEHFSGHWIS